MTLDLNRYRRAIKPICEAFVTREPDEDQNSLISRIALGTNCPITAVSYYMAELYGMTPELVRKIAFLKQFYNIIEVRGEIMCPLTQTT